MEIIVTFYRKKKTPNEKLIKKSTGSQSVCCHSEWFLCAAPEVLLKGVPEVTIQTLQHSNVEHLAGTDQSATSNQHGPKPTFPYQTSEV